MRCPFCSSADSKVIDSRPTEDGYVIRRRRECVTCGQRITTYEKIEETPTVIVKKNGTREQYNRSKILNGIIRACEKRPVTLEQMERLVDRIEARMAGGMEKEVSSGFLGEQVMQGLKDIDEVAYVRFASVYKEFKDLDSFKSELDRIVRERHDNSNRNE
ncbi:MAG: transcriptional regulator NrdR [Bacillota bacterium]|nr:transcriptional regulator NrdR [Bacillota bacterium]